MPVRRSTIYELRLDGYAEGTASLELHVSSGTYVRSVAEALGGHCRTLRRTAIGPFTVEEADWERIVSSEEALQRVEAWPAPTVAGERP
jgi:tRNA U55 pseudouridine synthase TruB